MARMLDPFEGIPPNCNRILLLGKEVSRIAPGYKPPRKAEKNTVCDATITNPKKRSSLKNYEHQPSSALTKGTFFSPLPKLDVSTLTCGALGVLFVPK